MKILDIFYNHIIKEALNGRINCYFYYNIIFSSNIENTIYNAKNDEDLIIPTLNIKNKKEFDNLLIQYVNKCLEFYDSSNYPEELNDSFNNDICKEKMIMTLLFATATFEDFEEPISFLKRKINFLEDYTTNINIGYSNILKSDIKINVKKDKINNEAPYQFIVNCDDNELPHLKFGIDNNIAYIYAIQNSKELDKKINRILYKVGEGFDKTTDNFDIYDEGNLNDITPSFLIVANLFISYLQTLGINDIKVCSFLPERWNAKLVANKLRNIDQEKQLKIQSNLTEKFIRTFLRLSYHYDNLKVLSYPMDNSSYLSLYNTGNIKCNNSLLLELNELCLNKKNLKI